MTFVESILQKRFIEVKVMFKVIDTVQTYIHKALYETKPTSSHTIQKKQSAHSWCRLSLNLLGLNVPYETAICLNARNKRS